MDSDCAVRSDEDGADDEAETSRRRCSTPISSASSASIDVGMWVNVRWVVVPSYSSARPHPACEKAYITDLLDGKVGICGNTSISPTPLGSNIHNDHHRSRAESLEQFRNLQI